MTADLDVFLDTEKRLSEGSWDQQNTVALGEFMKSRALGQNLGVAIALFFNGQRVYQVGLPGSSSLNDEWIARKANTVELTHQSSMALRKRVESLEIQEAELGFNSGHLAVCGGGYPLYSNGFLVGMAIVSGLPQEEDHEFIVESIEEFKRGLKW